ncbi:zinc fingers and homeoboxes protein 2-like [Stigmatopora argus]
MPGRRKSSAPRVIQIRGPGEPEDLEILDTELFSEDAPTNAPETGEKSRSLRNVDEPEGDDDRRPKMSEELRDEGGKWGSENAGRKKEPEGYECKRCPFWCQNLKDFKEHVDSRHPDVILNPLYRCAVCDFDTKKFELFTEHNKKLHPDENNFKLKRLKENQQTVLEQSLSLPSRCADAAGASPPFSAAPAKAPDPVESLRALFQPKDAIAALNINGTVIIPPSSVLRDPSSHVSPVLQRPPNFSHQPKIAVPLNGGKYDPSLDGNPTLMASFNKFPYPTHAELSWLTAASKHPEEQIRVWFTTQRLKQGITWSPEEVEEARKKMFNGSIPAARHSSFTTAGPEFVAAAAGSAHPPKRSMAAPGGPESKRPVAASAPGDPILRGPAVPPFAAETKKSPAVVPLMPGKILSLAGNPKSKPAASLPAIVFPQSLTRPTIAPPPIFAPPFAPSILVPPPLQREATFSDPSLLVGARARRPPVICAVPAPGKLPGLRMARDEAGESPAVADFPLLERMKGKTAEQLKILEEHFSRNSFLSRSDADNLALATRISRQEIDGWFAERRALRDNMELALLNSMGTKRTQADKDPILPLDGIGELRFGAEVPKRSYRAPPRAFFNSLPAPLLKNPSAQSGRTPPSEVWPGLARVDLARWFCDARSLPDAEFLHRGGGGPGLLEKNTLCDPCEEGGAKFQEAGPDGRANGVTLTQCGEMQDHFALPGVNNNADLPITVTRFVASATR